MSYDGFYGELSIRGTANDTLNQIVTLKDKVVVLAAEAEVSADRSENAAAIAEIKSTEAINSAASALTSKESAEISETSAGLSAQQAAIALVATSRFCGVSAIAPSTRLDGSALQQADEWHNSVDNLRYSWSGTAWVALNSSAQQLEERLSNKDTGGELIVLTSPGGAGVTLQDAMYSDISESPRVIKPVTYQLVQNSSDLKLSGGIFFVMYGGKVVMVAGPASQQQVPVASTTIAVVFDGLEFSSRDAIDPSQDTIVAWVKNGSLVEIIGGNGATSRSPVGSVRPIIPWLPPELSKIEESIPIVVSPSASGAIIYSTTFDVSSKKAASGVTYYVDVTRPNDSGDGLTEATAFKSILAAIQKVPLARIIMVKASGEYNRSYTWSASVTDRDLDVIGYGGKPKLSCYDAGAVWTKTPGMTNVYQTSRTQAGGVLDYANKPDRGRAQVLSLAASIALVDATPGSMHIDSANIVYINTFDSRAPDSNIRMLLNLTNGRVQDGSKVYIENLEFADSYRGFFAEVQTPGKAGYLYAKNVTFGLSVTENAFNNYGFNVILQDCTGEFGEKDALNHHSSKSLEIPVVPWIVEIGCIGRNSGFDGGTFHNGSTIHDGVVGLRLNGDYYGTYGRVVNDVSEGTVSVNIACNAHDSAWPNQDGSCFESGQASTGKTKMYLYSCKHGGPNYSVLKQGVSELYLFDTNTGNKPQYYAGTDPFKFIS